MSRRRGSGQKGTFADAHLKVARRYPPLRPRTSILVAGLLAAAAVGVWAAYDLTVGERQLATKGPLSSHHAGLDRECASCHVESGETLALTAGCVECHDPRPDAGFAVDLGADPTSSSAVSRFAVATHAVRVQRPVPIPIGDARVDSAELACSSCHTEHVGRDADIAAVADAECTNCHEGFAFAEGTHPEFAPVSSATESPGLLFSHTTHVPRIAERDDLTTVDATCVGCHEPEAQGASHLPIDFDRHCSSCHLQTGVTTDWLPLAEDPGDLWVEPLEAIRRGGAPGTRWAAAMSESQFLERRGRLRKIRIEHGDPWILHNLRRLAEMSGQNRSLQGLLETRADLEKASAPLAAELYAEALAELQRRRTALSGHPAGRVQAEIAALDELIERAGRVSESELTAEDVSAFVSLGAGVLPSDVDGEAFRDLESGLTAPCVECHVIERAAIVRVEDEQRGFFAASFDHSTHALSASCSDCHQRIDLANVLESAAQDSQAPGGGAEGAVTTSGEDGSESSVLDLPSLASCTSCHNSAASDDGCTLCHTYHSPGHEPTPIARRVRQLSVDGGLP